MIKKNLFMLFVFYFFVVQFLIAGILRDEQNFYLLGAINFVAILLLSFCYSFFTKEKESLPEEMLVREKNQKAKELAEEQEETPISESNIEYIKTKINRTKKQQPVQGGAIYRLLMFLLALIGFGGILYMFWDIFAFFAVLMGALGMMIFIVVIFKAARLWSKTIFSSVYFLFFLALVCAGFLGSFFGDQYPGVDQVKSQISTFIDGIKGEESQNSDFESMEDVVDTGFLFEETGEVLGMSLSGENLFSGEQLSGEVQTGGSAIMTGTLPEEAPSLPEEDQNKQVTMLEAIKYLIKENEIPLSSSKNVKFTHVAMSSEAYPYMKTALEKRMIGANTDPNAIVSCDVYMVMKGLVQGWSVAKNTDVKIAYWNTAVAKNALNGCKKGVKLTIGNL